MSTLTVYPDPHPETSTVDGQVYRSAASETFATIQGGAGTVVDDSTADFYVYLEASTTTNEFTQLRRCFVLFDTSPLTAGATISAATLSLWGISKNGNMGSNPLHIVSAAPASNVALVTGDFTTCGTTSFGTVAFASFDGTNSVYTDIALNASGLAAISLTGITKFGLRLDWDRVASFTGTWGSAQAHYYQIASAENASGTAHAPKLTITYTLGTTPTLPLFTRIGYKLI